jgi:L-alanine-DL-glutamate epimerase-like enolase superfamily enzyme
LIIRWRDGIGEGSPSMQYGATAGQLLQRLDGYLSAFEGDIAPDDLEDLISQLPPEMNVLRCALDTAYLDHHAKARRLPLHEHLGLPAATAIVSSLTICSGSEEQIRRQLAGADAFESLKLKVGFADDLWFIDLVLKHGERRLRLDANGGWTAGQAIERLRSLAGYPVEFIEQPLADPDLRSLDRIKSAVDSVIILDESIIDEHDLDRFSPVIDGANLKIARCGGLRRCLDLAERARALQLRLLLGCMIETAVGITAAAHLAPLFDYFDLDSILLTENDPFWGAHFDASQLILPEGHGIAVTIPGNVRA